MITSVIALFLNSINLAAFMLTAFISCVIFLLVRLMLILMKKIALALIDYSQWAFLVLLLAFLTLLPFALMVAMFGRV